MAEPAGIFTVKTGSYGLDEIAEKDIPREEWRAEDALEPGGARAAHLGGQGGRALSADTAPL